MVAVLLAPPFLTAHSQDHGHPKGGLGTVHFATTCSPGVASKFDHAVALLHSFEFGAAIRSFEEVLAADPDCAMAQWGIALSRWTNPMAAGNRPVEVLERGQRAARAAKQLGSRASARERGYIRAVNELYTDYRNRGQRIRVVAYAAAMSDLVKREPADPEAKIFYAIALTAAAPPTDKTYASQLEAGQILEPLWEKQPDHPGLAHYIIHTYDYPPLAGKAREAARRYAGIAPSAAHALHMPSHTFTRVGMWEESIETNQRSMAVALEGNSISEGLHAADYAMYAYLQLGREVEAKAILDRLPALAARFDPNAITGAAPGSAGMFALAAIPARWALERGAWAEAVRLEPRASPWPWTEAMTYFARSLGAARTGDPASAKVAIDSLALIQARLSKQGEAYWAEQVAIQHLGALAWWDLAEGRQSEALARMREAAMREDATEKSAVTPGPLAPARELLGDMLILMKRPTEAAAEYRATLKTEPNRRRTVRALATTSPSQE
jgi:hypothetical protein